MASGQVLNALLGKSLCDPGIHRPGKARCFGPLTLSYSSIILFYSILFSILFYSETKLPTTETVPGGPISPCCGVETL